MAIAQNLGHFSVGSEILLDLTFNLVSPRDLELLHRWLVQDHISEWLHGDGLQNTFKDLEASFEGKSWGEHWIAKDHGKPFAFLTTSWILPEERDESDFIPYLTTGEKAITLDVMICEVDYLNRGIGPQMIREFLLRHFSNVSKVFIDPELTNTRAIKAYEKVGFKRAEEFIASWHPVPHLKMILEMEKLKNV